MVILFLFLLIYYLLNLKSHLGSVSKGFKVVFKVGNKNLQSPKDTSPSQPVSSPQTQPKKPVFVIKTNKNSQETAQPPRKVIFKVPSSKKDIQSPNESKKRSNDIIQQDQPVVVKKPKVVEIEDRQFNDQQLNNLMVNPPVNNSPINRPVMPVQQKPPTSEHVHIKQERTTIPQKSHIPMIYTTGIPKSEHIQWDKPWKSMIPPNFERTPNGYNELAFFRQKQYFNKILSMMTSDKYKESIETFLNGLGDNEVLRKKKESAYNLFKARELENIELGKGTKVVTLSFEDIESLRSLQAELAGKIDLSFLNIYTS